MNHRLTDLLTLQFHAHLKATLEPASWALLSVLRVDCAIRGFGADEGFLVLDSPLEEALATLTSEDTIVVACTTNQHSFISILSNFKNATFALCMDKQSSMVTDGNVQDDTFIPNLCRSKLKTH